MHIDAALNIYLSSQLYTKTSYLLDDQPESSVSSLLRIVCIMVYSCQKLQYLPHTKTPLTKKTHLNL